MTPVEVYEFVEKDAELRGLGVDGDVMLIGNILNSIVTGVHINNLDGIKWDDLRSIIVGEREPKALKHMSRIIGYFSNHENWNNSKLAELKDRHEGNYAIT